MEFLGRLLLVLFGAYGLMGVVIGAHRLRKRYGLDLLFLLVGGLVVYSWWIVRLDLDLLRLGQFRFAVSTLGFYSVIFTTVLLVFISDGIRMSQRLIHGIVALEVVFVLLDTITALLARLTPDFSGRFPIEMISPAYGEMLWSISSLFLSLYIVVVVYHLSVKRFPTWNRVARLYAALIAGLGFDAIVYLMGLELMGLVGVEHDLFGSLSGELIARAAIAAGLAPVLGIYLNRQARTSENELSRTGAFDIFRSAELLQQSLSKSRALYKALFDHVRDAVFTMDDDGFLLDANPRFFELTGREEKEVQAGRLHYTSFVHPDHRPELIEKQGRLQADGDGFFGFGLHLQTRENVVPCHWDAVRLGPLKSGETSARTQVLLHLMEPRPSEHAAKLDLLRRRLADMLHGPLRTLLDASGENATSEDFHRLREPLRVLVWTERFSGGERRKPHSLEALWTETLETFQEREALREIQPEWFGKQPKLVGDRELLVRLLSALFSVALEQLDGPPSPENLRIAGRKEAFLSGKEQTIFEFWTKGSSLSPALQQVLEGDWSSIASEKESLHLAFACAAAEDLGGELQWEEDEGWQVFTLRFTYERHEVESRNEAS